jgi:hypothetical protein
VLYDYPRLLGRICSIPSTLRRLFPAGVATLVPLTCFSAAAVACACGCGVFDVGADMIPPQMGSGSVWFRYDFMDQNQNWEGTSKAPASDNLDKRLYTNFYTIGGDYSLSENWTVMAELPTYQRSLKTTDDGTVAGSPGSIYTGHIFDMGDLEVSTTYTGLFPDMSTGLMFGVILPTGNYTGPNGPLGGSEFDRDSLPGTGATSIMLGGFHAGELTFDGTVGYFVQVRYTNAIFSRDQYRPGNELDAAVGLNYNFGQVGPFTNIAPTLSLINSDRNHDTGANADPLNSGYERLLIAPGIALQLKQWRLYTDIELPVYQHTNAASSPAINGTAGQLVAPALYKLELAYDF